MLALKLGNLVSGTMGLKAVIFTSGQSPESPKEKDILSSDRPQVINTVVIINARASVS